MCLCEIAVSFFPTLQPEQISWSTWSPPYQLQRYIMRTTSSSYCSPPSDSRSRNVRLHNTVTQHTPSRTQHDFLKTTHNTPNENCTQGALLGAMGHLLSLNGTCLRFGCVSACMQWPRQDSDLRIMSQSCMDGKYDDVMLFARTQAGWVLVDGLSFFEARAQCV